MACHAPVWAAVGEATALDEPEVSDVVYGAILPRHHERGFATGGQGKVLRKDGVEYDVFATARLAKDPEMPRKALGEREAGLLVEECREADGRRREGVR